MNIFQLDTFNKFTFDDSEYENKLNEITSQLSESTIFSSRNYQGHMNYDISNPHITGYNLGLKYNQNQVAVESSPVTTKYEISFIKNMINLFGYDQKSWGYISSGGTINNIMGLWIAREKNRSKGNNSNIVLVSEFGHYSIKKACKILDLVPFICKTDHQGRIVLPENLNHVLAIVVNIGTTETGICDDLEGILNKVKNTNIYIHADASYGGYYIYLKNNNILSDYTRTQFKCLAQTDSISVDPHKLGFAPYGCGVFLLKNGIDRKFISCSSEVNYIDTSISSDTTIEGSRSGAMAVSVFLGHEILNNKYQKLMEALIRGSEMLKSELKTIDNISLYENTDLGIVLFTCPNIEYLSSKFCKNENHKNDRLTLVTTVIDNVKYFRIVIMDPYFEDYCKEFTKKLIFEMKMYFEDYENDIQRRFLMLKSIASECDTDADLLELVRSGKKFVAYNGFEPSGRIHIAQAIITVINSNTIIDAGGKVILYIADWFAKLNHKLGGDLEKIRDVGRYFIEVFKACGLNQFNTEFIWAKDLIEGNPKYWEQFLDIGTKMTLNRVKKCCTIMGRSESDTLSASQIFYPAMQATDALIMNVDICQMGIDQRKVNMLIRDYCSVAGRKSPVILSHKMLMGLQGTKSSLGKMSKSDPKSCIFMEDTFEDIQSKIKMAFCNDSVIDNPIFEYIKYILIRWYHKITLCGKEYDSIEEIEKDFPLMNKSELKSDVSKLINGIIEPVRTHFSTGEMKELAERVASYRTSR